jgi:hypothetical protein
MDLLICCTAKAVVKQFIGRLVTTSTKPSPFKSTKRVPVFLWLLLAVAAEVSISNSPAKLLDINGDGLVDMLYGKGDSKAVLLKALHPPKILNRIL